MPRRTYENYLNAKRGRPGWESAEVAFEESGERMLVMRPSSRSDQRELVSTKRRMFFNRNDSLLPIDTEWKVSAGLDYEADFGEAIYTVPASTIADLTTGNVLDVSISGEAFGLRPANDLNWENDSGGIEAAQSIRANTVGLLLGGVDTNVIRWANAYGNGIHYDIVLGQDRLFKRIRVPNRNVLGNPRLTGNVFLALKHVVSISRGTTIHYFDDGQGQFLPWDMVSEITTSEPLEMRKNGVLLYRIRLPFLSVDNPAQAGRKFFGGSLLDQHEQQTELYTWYRLQMIGGEIILTSCFSRTLIQSINGGFYLDPSIDTDAVGDTSDAEDNSYSGTRPNTGKNYADVATYGGGAVRWVAAFDVSAMSDSDTPTSAYVQASFGGVNTALNIRAVGEIDYAFPTSGAECNADIAAFTASSVSWSGQSAFTQNQNSPDISTVIQDFLDVGGTVGNIGIWIVGATSPATVTYLIGYSGYEESLHIVYTVGGGGPSIPVVMNQLRQQGIS